MTFPGKPPEAPKTAGPLKTYHYLTEAGDLATLQAHHAYFYESGHIGFWEDLPDDKRRLVLAIRTNKFWEEKP